MTSFLSSPTIVHCWLVLLGNVSKRGKEAAGGQSPWPPEYVARSARVAQEPAARSEVEEIRAYGVQSMQLNLHTVDGSLRKVRIDTV
jgi:hypothetical protein